MAATNILGVKTTAATVTLGQWYNLSDFMSFYEFPAPAEFTYSDGTVYAANGGFIDPSGNLNSSWANPTVEFREPKYQQQGTLDGKFNRNVSFVVPGYQSTYNPNDYEISFNDIQVRFLRAGTTKLQDIIGNTFAFFENAIIPLSPPYKVSVSRYEKIDLSAPITVIGSSLFTTGRDTVDFSNLQPEQREAILGGADPTDALDGNDTVTLPDANAVASFVGTQGSLVLTQTFKGGAGADTFMLPPTGLSSYAPNTILHVDGGLDPAGATLGQPFKTLASVDQIVLPGSPDQYSITVDYRDPAQSHTVFNHLLLSPLVPTNKAVDTVGVEYVSFTTLGVANTVRLDQSNLYAEMARLCAEVYGPKESLTHGNEKLASELANDPTLNLNVGDRAIRRGWHEVAALELGLRPFGSGSSDYPGLRYAFTNGFYEAIGPSGLTTTIETEANALVLTGIVDSKKTLAVVFRGTDQKADWLDYASFMADHYSKFAPLRDALVSYVGNHPVDQVLIAGHSLGAGIAQLFATDMQAVPSKPAIQLITFGSPGAETPAAVPQTNFRHALDPVTAVPDATTIDTLPGALTRLALYGALAFEISPVNAAKVVNALKTKVRSGADVTLSSLIQVTLTDAFAQHAMGLVNATDKVEAGYLRDMDKLVSYAQDTFSPFSRTDLGIAIKAGKPFTGDTPRISLGDSTGAGGVVAVNPDDGFALGDTGQSNTFTWQSDTPSVRPVFIDGGAHAPAQRNKLQTEFGFGSLRIEQAGDHQRLFDPAVSTTAPIAVVYRVEDLIQRPTGASFLTPADILRHFDGSPTTVQKPRPGETSLVVDGSADVAYAGDGVATVDSTVAGAKVVYGPDTTMVRVSGAGSLAMSDNKPGAAPLMIDTGAGAVSVMDGVRDATFIAHLSGATLDGGEGRNTVQYDAGRSAVTTIGNGDGSITVASAKATGSDVVRSMSELRFIDGRVVFDPSDPAAAVARLYQAGLDRAPEQGDLNFWIGAVQAGTPLADLATGFLTSTEFTSRFGDGLGNEAFVTAIYQNVLGRPPEAGGLAFWTGNLDRLVATRGQTFAGISESDENKSASAALVNDGIWDRSEAAQQVARLYDTALGRLPDAGGLGFWTQAFERGTATLTDLAQSFVTSAEFVATYGSFGNRAFVQKVYGNTLGREGDTPGVDFWTGTLDAGASRASVTIGFSESAEHQAKTATSTGGETVGSYGVKLA